MGKDKLDIISESLDELESIFNESFEEDQNRIDIRDRVLSDCLKDQLDLMLAWQEITKEAALLASDIENEKDRIFSIAFQELSNNSHKALSFNEAKIFAQSDNDYVETLKVLNRANTLKAKCESINDAIKSRQFILKNMCDVLRDGNDGYII